MQMTKQRKLMVGVLCAGLGALALDRLVLAPPDSASADQAQPAATDASAAALSSTLLNRQDDATDDDRDQDASALPSYASLTERLMALQTAQTAQAGQVLDARKSDAEPGPSDPFAVPEGWAPKPKPVSTAPTTQAEGPQPGQAFLARHRLAATLNDAGKQRAVVDGKLMTIGDELEGYKLIRINPRWVIWESLDGKQAVVMHTEQGPS